jgi:hypothetical protein
LRHYRPASTIKGVGSAPPPDIDLWSAEASSSWLGIYSRRFQSANASRSAAPNAIEALKAKFKSFLKGGKKSKKEEKPAEATPAAPVVAAETAPVETAPAEPAPVVGK